MSTLEKTLSQLMSDDEGTPVDVLMKMLDPQDAVMHTDIKAPGVMTAIDVMIAHREAQNHTRSAEAWKRLKEGCILYQVSKDRKREKAMVKMFAGMAAMAGYPAQNEQKGGLFGGAKK